MPTSPILRTESQHVAPTLLAVAWCAALLSIADPVCAQTFTYAHPSSTFVDFPLAFGSAPQNVALSDRTLTSREFVDDVYGSGGAPAPFPATSIRMAANLNQQYRVIGNPYMFFPYWYFSGFNMDSTAGTVFDRVYFDQFYASAPASATGVHSPPFAINPTSLPSTASMTWRGFIFRVKTGPDRPRQVPPLANAESWGFITDHLHVTVATTIHDSWLPTFSPYESIIGVLNANDDVVRAVLAPNPGYTATVATWNVAPNNPAWGVGAHRIYERSGITTDVSGHGRRALCQ